MNRFTPDGDLFLYGGTVHAGATSEVRPAFIVKNAEGDNLLCMSYDIGVMYIKGIMYEHKSDFVDPPNALKIKYGDTLVAFVTGSSYTDAAIELQAPHTVPAGSLVLKGWLKLR